MRGSASLLDVQRRLEGRREEPRAALWARCSIKADPPVAGKV